MKSFKRQNKSYEVKDADVIKIYSTLALIFTLLFFMVGEILQSNIFRSLGVGIIISYLLFGITHIYLQIRN